MTPLILFAAAFVIVFALGFQSLCVNQGRHKTAFLNSLIIGSSNLVILKMIPDTNSIPEITAYLLGGPFGIVASMWVHRRTLGRGKSKKLPTEEPAPLE